MLKFSPMLHEAPQSTPDNNPANPAALPPFGAPDVNIFVVSGTDQGPVAAFNPDLADQLKAGTEQMRQNVASVVGSTLAQAMLENSEAYRAAALHFNYMEQLHHMEQFRLSEEKDRKKKYRRSRSEKRSGVVPIAQTRTKWGKYGDPSPLRKAA